MKPDIKYDRILDAATELFRDSHNVRKVSINDIALRARVSPTTIYHYFGTRENLVIEVAKRLILQTIERSKGILHSNLPFPQKLVGIISRKMDIASQMNNEIVTKIVGQDKNMAGFVDKIYRDELKPIWHEFIIDGKKQGYIDDSLDEEAFFIYQDVLRYGFTSRPEIFKDFQNNMGLIENLTMLVFYGFLKKDIALFQKEGSAHG
jgi:AcrR family transcriptional regulator